MSSKNYISHEFWLYSFLLSNDLNCSQILLILTIFNSPFSFFKFRSSSISRPPSWPSRCLSTFLIHDLSNIPLIFLSSHNFHLQTNPWSLLLSDLSHWKRNIQKYINAGVYIKPRWRSSTESSNANVYICIFVTRRLHYNILLWTSSVDIISSWCELELC